MAPTPMPIDYRPVVGVTGIVIFALAAIACSHASMEGAASQMKRGTSAAPSERKNVQIRSTPRHSTPRTGAGH
jgi:hypothetical protein